MWRGRPRPRPLTLTWTLTYKPRGRGRPRHTNFFDASHPKLFIQCIQKQIDRLRHAIYHQWVNVSFLPNARPVLYLLLYGCVHWRQGAADLRII